MSSIKRLFIIFYGITLFLFVMMLTVPSAIEWIITGKKNLYNIQDELMTNIARLGRKTEVRP